MDPAGLAADPRTLVLGYNGSIEQLHPQPAEAALAGQRDALDVQLAAALRRAARAPGRPGRVAGSGRPTAAPTPSACARTSAGMMASRVTADDVVFTAELLQQPHRYFRNTLHLATGEPAVFAQARRPHRRVELPRPYAALPAYLTATWASLFLIVPQPPAGDGDEDAFDAHPVGSGPFRFGEITDDGDAVLLGQRGVLRRPAAGRSGRSSAASRRTRSGSTPSVAASSISSSRPGAASPTPTRAGTADGCSRCPRIRSSSSR